MNARYRYREVHEDERLRIERKEHVTLDKISNPDESQGMRVGMMIELEKRSYLRGVTAEVSHVGVSARIDFFLLGLCVVVMRGETT